MAQRPEFPGASVHHGIDAVKRDLERQLAAWGESRYEPTFRDDKVLRVQAFVEREQALAAAGIARTA